MGKAMGAMGAMKAMKKKTVSKIATGKRAKSSVFKGGKEKTVGGLTKSDLVMNSRGKVVSKKRSALAKKMFKNSPLKAWADAVQKARKELGVKGFVAIKKGSALYKKAKELVQ